MYFISVDRGTDVLRGLAMVRVNDPHAILCDGAPVLVRQLVVEDAGRYPEFLQDVTPEDLRLRFFRPCES
jgi:hypothetical protein